MISDPDPRRSNGGQYLPFAAQPDPGSRVESGAWSRVKGPGSRELGSESSLRGLGSKVQSPLLSLLESLASGIPAPLDLLSNISPPLVPPPAHPLALDLPPSQNSLRTFRHSSSLSSAAATAISPVPLSSSTCPPPWLLASAPHVTVSLDTGRKRE
eukprot:1482500-Rhodomonas_salina.1